MPSMGYLIRGDMEFNEIIANLPAPYYRDNQADIAIYCGDCREILPLLPDKSVDLVLTSPPYNIGLDYGDSFIDKISDDEWHKFTDDWLREGYRIASDGCRMYVAVSEKMLWWFKPMLEDVGWTYSQIFVWCKTNFVGGTRRISGEWNAMTDWILISRKGKRLPMIRWNDTNTVNWYACATPQSNFNEGRYGPAQLPIKLVSRLISRTPGDIITDPFMGTGTTLRAAKNLNRKSIGIEISEEYCEIAAKRLSQGVMELI